MSAIDLEKKQGDVEQKQGDDIEMLETRKQEQEQPQKKTGFRIESEFVDLTRWQATRVFWKPTLLSVMAMAAILMDGFAISTTGNIVSNAGFIKQFGTVVTATGAVALDSRHVSLWGGLVNVGSVAGHQIGSLCADRWGRVPTRILFTVLLMGSAFGEMFAKNWQSWAGAKVLLGIGQGCLQAVTLSYVCEIAPTQIRGALVAVYGIFFALGQLVSAVALQIVQTTDPLNYLKGVYSQWALLGVWILCMPWLPESPWWLARGHRHDACIKVLKSLNRHVAGYDAEREYLYMKEEIEHEEEFKTGASVLATYREVFTFPNLKRTIAGACGLTLLQWSGASIVFTYATYFFQQAGIDQPFQCTCITYGILLFGSIVSVLYLTENFGRRALLLTGGTACCVINFLIGGLGTMKKSPTVNNAELALICIWVLFYASCMAGVSWGLSSEIASPRLRAKTTACAQNFNASWAIIFSFTTPLMLAASGPGAVNWGVKTTFLYAFLGGFGTIINFFTLPEVRGRTFNEMDEMYEAGIPPRKMKSYRTLVEQAGTKTHV